MLIKDLPAEIQKRVFECQVEQGNVECLDTNLGATTSMGNFNWSETREGDNFWRRILHGFFSGFYEMYPKVDLQKEEEDLYKFLNS